MDNVNRDKANPVGDLSSAGSALERRQEEKLLDALVSKMKCIAPRLPMSQEQTTLLGKITIEREGGKFTTGVSSSSLIQEAKQQKNKKRKAAANSDPDLSPTHAKKTKMVEDISIISSLPIKRKRGRPPKRAS
jgi:hypothetical protein